MEITVGDFRAEQLQATFRVALFSVPVEGWGVKLDRSRSEGSLGIVPKVAIVALVKWMERNGYLRENWDFFDIDMLYPNDEDIEAYLEIYHPQVVGLSAVVSTSYTQVKRLSHLIRKKCPDALIVMGGNLAASAEAVLANTDVDLAVVGDGEVAWVEILNRSKVLDNRRDKSKYQDIEGVCIYMNSRVIFSSFGKALSADDLPLPDYDILEQGLRFQPDSIWNYFRPGIKSGWFNLDKRAAEHERPPNIAGLFASKGCVAKCTFCQRSTKGYRVQPYEELDNHLKMLRERFNVGFIQILDENFGSDRKHSHELARIIHDNKMLWMATGVRCTSVKEEDIVFYKAHGCSALKFGVESGSQLILDLMEKVFSVRDVYSAIDICINHGVYSPLAVMVGMPGETELTAKETGEMIGTIAAKVGIHPKLMGYDIFYALPLPGTPLYEYGELVGVIDKSPAGAGAYLERVTDAGTYKRYFVNLNGAHISEVLFWDVLVALEASRTYHLKAKDVTCGEQSYGTLLRESREQELKNNPRWSLKYTALQFTLITWAVDTYVIGSKYLDRLPRAILYPFVKLALYFEFTIQRLYIRNRNNNLFLMDGSKVKRLLAKDSEGGSAKSKSLRGIVNRMNGKVAKSKVSFIPRLQYETGQSRELLSKGL